MFKFLGIMVTLDKIVVLNLERDIFKTSNMVAIFAKREISTIFCSFLHLTLKINRIFEFWKFHVKKLTKYHKNNDWSFRKNENLHAKTLFFHENLQIFRFFGRFFPHNFKNFRKSWILIISRERAQKMPQETWLKFWKKLLCFEKITSFYGNLDVVSPLLPQLHTL